MVVPRQFITRFSWAMSFGLAVNTLTSPNSLVSAALKLLL